MNSIIPEKVLFAFDRASVRSYDHDGRLHLTLCHISKSNVCPYLGKEIPNAEMLGLKPRTVYQLLRDPDELAKAVKTLNNIQLLIKHDPVSAEDPKKDLVIGSTGTDAVWNDPYLDNSLVVWDQDGIDGIEDDTQKELSAGYYYTADMTPGIYEGVAYDGVMRNIRFNHVALVVEGRAGDDVIVGDSMESLNMNRKTLLSRKAAMAKGAIVVCLSPRLAQDAKIDLNSILTGITPANWGASKKKVVAWLGKLPAKTFKDKPAMDAGIQDVMKLLDSLDGENPDGGTPDDSLSGNQDSTLDGTLLTKGTGMDDEPDESLEGALAPNGTGMSDDPADPSSAITALLQGKVDDDTLQQVLQLMQGTSAKDETDEFMDKLTGKKKVPVANSGGVEAGEGNDAGMNGPESAQVGKGAPLDLPAKPVTSSGGKIQESPKVNQQGMDAAIQKAKKETKLEVTKQLRDIAEAEKAVKPLIGEVIAQDSAEAVYRLALDHFEVDVEGVHPSAYKAMVSLLAKTTEEKKKPQLKMAHDSKNVVKFAERFPTAGKVRQLG
jgi:hypothetical protein